MDCCNSDRVLANALVQNGPEVPIKVVALVESTFAQKDVPYVEYEGPDDPDEGLLDEDDM